MKWLSTHAYVLSSCFFFHSNTSKAEDISYFLIFFCEASISVKFKSNARETWHAILVSFADIYPTESLCILHFVPVGTKPEVVTLIILALQFPIIRIKHRCRGTHCDGVGNRFSQIYTHYRIWHKMR